MTVQVAFGARGNRIGATLGALAFAALFAAPWWGGREDLQLLSEIYTYVALASLWNLLAGYAGLVSVGQQAYVGLGAYVLFALAILFGVSPLWSIPLAGVIAAGLSIPVALLVFRLRGHYFAIGTWIVAEVFRLTASQVGALGGGSGISLPAGISRYVVHKGSIAVDGISLTVSALGPPGGETWFEVCLIPETLKRTTMGARQPGEVVNLEVDVIAKYVERLLNGEANQ